MADSKRGMDAFGAFSYLLYVAVGGFLVFGFAWSIRGAVATQNEAVCGALRPEHRNRVRGFVRDSSGAPVPKASVTPVVDEDVVGVAMPVAEDGAFEVFLPEGSQVVRVEALGMETLDAPIVVGRKESVDVEVTLVSAGAAGGSMSEQGRSVFEAPDLALQDLAGNTVHLSDFRGKFVVLNFWATWCEPCIAEWPQVHQLWGRLEDRDDVVVLAISIDSEREAIEPFLARMGLSDTGVTVLWDPEQSSHRRFGTEKIPDTYFVNEAGEVVHTYVDVRKWGAPEAFHCVDGSIGG